MKLKDYTQGKSVKELEELYRSGEILKLDPTDKGEIYRYVRAQLTNGEGLSKKDQLRAAVLLDEKNYSANNVVAMLPKLHPRTIALLELDRHEGTRDWIHFHQSQPLDVLLARGKAKKYPTAFYHGLNGRELDRELEMHLLKLTRRYELLLLMRHLTIRHDDREFQQLLLESFARMSGVGRIGVVYLKIWSSESLDSIQKNYSDDVKLMAHLCTQSLLPEDASMRILGGTTTHGIRSSLVSHTKHYSIWENLSKRSKSLARSGGQNPYFGDNHRADAYRKSLEGQNNGS